MRTRRRFFSILTAVWLSMAARAFAGVDGTVVNRTTGKPQSNVVVSLVQPNQSGMETLGSSKTDAAGKFQIDKDGASGPQLLQALYAGVTYTKMIPPGTPASGVTVEVFDSSSKPGDARVSKDFILFQPSTQQTQVEEFLLAENPSNVTYNNPGKGTVDFYLPPEAGGKVTVNVTGPGGMPVNRPAQKTAEANIYRVDYPLRPGETRFGVGYSLPAAQPMLVSGKILHQGVLQLVVPPGVKVQGENITVKGQEPQTKFLFYEVRGAEFKAEIQGTVTQRKQPSETTAEDDSGQPKIHEIEPPIYEKLFLGQKVIYWILGFAVTILGLGLIALYRSGKPQPSAEGASGAASNQTRKGAVSR